MSYTIRITNKKNDVTSANLKMLDLETISPSLIDELRTTYNAYVSDMSLGDDSIYIPVYKKLQVVKIPADSLLTITTDDADEALYYAQLKVNNALTSVDPDPITGGRTYPVLIEKTITENGLYLASQDNADGYSSVNVSVENSYTADDEGKVVSDGSLVAQTAYPTTITENNTYDTTNYNSITVDVSGGSSSSNIVARCIFDFTDSQLYLENENNVIEDNLFYECSTLNEVIITNNVTEIGDNAFDSCESLVNVTFEENSNLETIGDRAFNYCPLTSITIPNSVTSIGDHAFNETGLETVTFEAGSNLETIGDYSFYNCTSLASVTIPNSVTSIGDYAFQLDCSLTSITIPSSVTSIGNSAFSDCESLETVTFGENSNLETIDVCAFSACPLTSITIPSSVTSIGDHAFDSCESLETVTFEAGSNLETIGDYSFYNCSLTSVTIPSNVISIGERAFYDGSENLETMTFEPTTPPELGSYLGIPTTCTIRVPQGTLSAYTSAEYYPDPSEYTYEEY